MTNPMDLAHLLNNGHLRCGIFKGHISLGFQGHWPLNLRLTANAEATTCPNCRDNANLPPIEVPQDLEVLVENIKILSDGKPAMEALAEALVGSTTLREMAVYSRRVAQEMQT